MGHRCFDVRGQQCHIKHVVGFFFGPILSKSSRAKSHLSPMMTRSPRHADRGALGRLLLKQTSLVGALRDVLHPGRLRVTVQAIGMAPGSDKYDGVTGALSNPNQDVEPSPRPKELSSIGGHRLGREAVGRQLALRRQLNFSKIEGTLAQHDLDRRLTSLPAASSTTTSNGMLPTAWVAHERHGS